MRTIRSTWIRAAALLAAVSLWTIPGGARAGEEARAIVARSMAAMGGASRLRAIRHVEFRAVGNRAMVEQSERPTGPYLVDQIAFHEVLDFATGAARIEQSDGAYGGANWWLTQPSQPASTEFVQGTVDVAQGSDGKIQYLGGYDVSQVRERIALGPERVLLTAAAAPDLHALSDVMLHGVRHHVLAFSWQGAACRLYLSAATGLPWKVVWRQAYPYQLFLNTWGDVTSEVTFTAWSLEPGGLHIPRELTYIRVGLPDQQLFVTEFHAGPEAGTAAAMPAGALAEYRGRLAAIDRRAFDAPGRSAPTMLAPGVVLRAASWNVAFVEQPDGVVVIEAPISPNYARGAFAYARRHFGKPVKAVITTSDSWPHIAGFAKRPPREFRSTRSTSTVRFSSG